MSYGGSSSGSSRISTSADTALSNPLAGDALTYNASVQKWVNGPVGKVSGVTISGTPSSGQSLVATDATSASWQTVAGGGTASDASTTAKGVVQLAGDLGGTAAAPTVAKVNGVAVSGTPANGQVLTASSASAASWTTPAGGGALGNSGVTAGTYGSSTQIPIVTVNAQGLVTGASNVTAAGGSGSGSTGWKTDYRAQNMRDLGANGDNTYNDAQFLAAVTAAKGGGRTVDTPYMYDPLGTVVIEIPAGDYRLSQINGLLGREGMTSKLSGLVFRGAGHDLTRIILDTSSNGNAIGAMVKNDYWQNLTFEGISFDCKQQNQTFMQSYTTNAAQYYKFVDCYWNGPYKYVFDLQGNNNNSEFAFYNCGTYGMNRNVDAAFLYVGSTNTSDQFLNYWFYNFKHQSTDACLIKAYKGGSFHIYALDCSDWGANSGLAGDNGVSPALFKLMGDNHSLGVTTFNATGVRVEAKNAEAMLLYSEWPFGNVTFRNVDFGSQAFAYSYNHPIEINVTNNQGAIYSFQDSVLSGQVYVHYGTAYNTQRQIIFERCLWLTQFRPSDVVRYDTANGPNKPAVRFINCMGQQQNAQTGNGAAVWDATIGYKGEMLVNMVPRVLSVRSSSGKLQASVDATLKYLLPTGATILSVEIMIPAGDTTDTATNRTWTINDGDGNLIVTAAFAPSLNAGGRQETTLPVPYLASTDKKATLQISANSVSTNVPNGLMLIKGYW